MQELVHIQTKCDSDKLLSKYENLPKLIQIVESCYEQNLDLQDYLTSVQRRRLIDFIEQAEQNDIFDMLLPSIERPPHVQKLLL